MLLSQQAQFPFCSHLLRRALPVYLCTQNAEQQGPEHATKQVRFCSNQLASSYLQYSAYLALLSFAWPDCAALMPTGTVQVSRASPHSPTVFDI